MVRDITKNKFIVLSPSARAISRAFRRPEFNQRRHERLLASVQRFRGAIYAADGAVAESALTSDGRHCAPGDAQAWHLVSVGPTGDVRACLRYLEETHAGDFDNLLVRHAAAAASPTGFAFRRAVEDELLRARREGIKFGEVGGWAVHDKFRNTTESLNILLAMYGLLQLLGGCLGVATATWRHHSAGILRRIGLRALEDSGAELQPYFEPKYDCQMEILSFDSRHPNPKYRDMVKDFSADLRQCPVYFADGELERTAASEPSWGFDLPLAQPALA